ncbi:PREDICTED: trichohyalin-like [Haliaeetus leucocephalus]|uniref:trichohyalin-like n=1 Tax=Haliaeetus leucocephalus TaxID=52644 RepID=UPI00053CCED5|nr:PREDICTED: trichohyalin-like [Haliaeetus leucocephalus]
MSRFLDSISTIISVFHKHAKEDGDSSNLSQRKMKEFIQREFADIIDKPHDPQTIDKILQFLEWDGDREIDFNEFLLLVFRVAKACYWYLPKGPCLLQRTKLTTSGKSLREPDIKNRGSRQQLQEEEQQTCESKYHPPCEPELQRDTRINELETLEEMGSHHQQHNTQSRNDAKLSSKPGESTPQEYEERNQKPRDQQKSQNRRQPLEPDRRGDVQHRKCSSLQAQEARLKEDERQNQEVLQPEQLADVRSHSQSCEPQALPNRWSSHQPHETALPAYDQKTQQPQRADIGSHNQPRKPELGTKKRSRYHVRELEQKALEHSSHEPHEPECRDSKNTHQSYIQKPLQLHHRYYETSNPRKQNSEKGKKQEHESEYQKGKRDIHMNQECEKQEDTRRKEPIQNKRTDLQQEQELELYKHRSQLIGGTEEQGATTNQKETRERRDRQTRQPKDDGRRQRESVRYERTRETAVAAAEAKVEIQRVSQELEPRQDVERRDRPRERNEPEDERRICRGREREEPVRDRRIDRQRELDLELYERRSHLTRETEEQGVMGSRRDTRKRSSLHLLEEEQEREILQHYQANKLLCEPSECTASESSEGQEWQNHRLLHEEEGHEPNGCPTHEDEEQRRKRSLYQTIEVDNRHLSPPGEQVSVTDMRVCYIPAEPDVRPEVQVAPQPCEPQTIACLIHVIQNLNDPEATTYEIVCHQPHDLGQPIYVKKCYMSPQLPAVPCDRSNHPEPLPQRDERETGEPETPQQGSTPAFSSQENRGDLNEPQERSETGVKEGAHQASASKPDGVKGDSCQAKPKAERRDSQHPTMPDAEEKEHQPQGDGSKPAREQVLQEPESSCQVSKHEDREAKSCPSLPQAPEPQEACEPGQRATKESRSQPPWRDEASHCHEDAEVSLPEKSRQPRQENSKGSSQQVSNAQPQQEEEPHLCSKQSQGPPSPPVSEEAPSRPARDEAKAS